MSDDSLHRCVHCKANTVVYSCLDNDVANKPNEVNLRCTTCGSVFDVECALEELGYQPISTEDQQFWSQF